MFQTPQFLLLTIALSLPASQVQEIKLRWAFGAMTGPADARKFVRIIDDITLRTGDEVQMFLSPATACFVYVLHEDTVGNVTVLFPETGAFPPGYGIAKTFYVPARTHWLQLDAATGIERIYLVAATQRLSQLEALLKRPAPPGDAKARRNQVVRELARLTKQSATSWSERPVTIGGQIRGLPKKPSYPDIAEHAVEITAAGFFSRAFVIESLSGTRPARQSP